MPIDDIRQFTEELEKAGQLKRIKTEVDTNLEIAEILRRVSYTNGPAILFENIKGSRYSAVSNLFGTLERSNFIFRNSIHKVKKINGIKTIIENVA